MPPPACCFRIIIPDALVQQIPFLTTRSRQIIRRYDSSECWFQMKNVHTTQMVIFFRLSRLRLRIVCTVGDCFVFFFSAFYVSCLCFSITCRLCFCCFFFEHKFHSCEVPACRWWFIPGGWKFLCRLFFFLLSISSVFTVYSAKVVRNLCISKLHAI